MDKVEHGPLLKAAMGRKGYSRTTVADVAGVKPRTVTNWTSGSTMPSESERAALRTLLGNYDASGDPVVAAIEDSRLVEDRQHLVIGEYKRQLRYQDAEEAEGRAG